MSSLSSLNTVRKVVCSSSSGEPHAFYYRVSNGEFLGSTHHSETELRSMIDLCFMLPDNALFPDFGCNCVSAILGIANSNLAWDFQMRGRLPRAELPLTIMDPFDKSHI